MSQVQEVWKWGMAVGWREVNALGSLGEEEGTGLQVSGMGKRGLERRWVTPWYQGRGPCGRQCVP